MIKAPQHTHPDDTFDLLSGLLDDQLAGTEQDRARSLIESCAGCSADWTDLQAMRRLLSDLPLIQPTRSFTLDPDRVHPARGFWWSRWFRWAGAGALLAVLLLVGAVALENGRARSSVSMSAAPKGATTGLQSDNSTIVAGAIAPVPPDAAARSQSQPGSSVPALPESGSSASTAESSAAGGAGALSAPVPAPALTLPPVAGANAASPLNSTSRVGPAATTIAGAAAQAQPTATAVIRRTEPISRNQTAELAATASVPPRPSSTATAQPSGPSIVRLVLYGGAVLVVLAVLALLLVRRQSP